MRKFLIPFHPITTFPLTSSILSSDRIGPSNPPSPSLIHFSLACIRGEVMCRPVIAFHPIPVFFKPPILSTWLFKPSVPITYSPVAFRVVVWKECEDILLLYTPFKLSFTPPVLSRDRIWLSNPPSPSLIHLSTLASYWRGTGQNSYCFLPHSSFPSHFQVLGGIEYDFPKPWVPSTTNSLVASYSAPRKDTRTPYCLRPHCRSPSYPQCSHVTVGYGFQYDIQLPSGVKSCTLPRHTNNVITRKADLWRLSYSMMQNVNHIIFYIYICEGWNKKKQW